jgi:hypothetical protein
MVPAPTLVKINIGFGSHVPLRPLEDQRPCGKVLRSSSFRPHEGLKRTPETTQEAQNKNRDGSQKRTKGNLKEVMSPVLRCHLLRLGRSFVAGKRPSHSLVANSQR